MKVFRIESITSVIFRPRIAQQAISVNRAELSTPNCLGLSKLSSKNSPSKPFLSAKRFSLRSCSFPPALLPLFIVREAVFMFFNAVSLPFPSIQEPRSGILSIQVEPSRCPSCFPLLSNLLRTISSREPSHRHPRHLVPQRAKTARTAKPIYRRAARPLSRENQSTSIRSFLSPFALGPSNPHPVNRAELSARCPQASCPGLSKLSPQASPSKPFLSAKRFSPRSCRFPPAPLPLFHVREAVFMFFNVDLPPAPQPPAGPTALRTSSFFLLPSPSFRRNRVIRETDLPRPARPFSRANQPTINHPPVSAFVPSILSTRPPAPESDNRRPTIPEKSSAIAVWHLKKTSAIAVWMPKKLPLLQFWKGFGIRTA